jgi:hypothetical protein
MEGKKEIVEKIRKQYILLLPVLDERARRQWAASEAESYGRGGSAWVCEATGISHNTISKGKNELDERRKLPEGKESITSRIRKEGGGRKSLEKKDAKLSEELEKLIASTTRGDPMSPLCWTTKSTINLAEALIKNGHPISPRSVSKMLIAKGYRG